MRPNLNIETITLRAGDTSTAVAAGTAAATAATRDATWAAATAAARDAAVAATDAATAAATRVLAPTVERLQASTQDLVRRMCEVRA